MPTLKTGVLRRTLPTAGTGRLQPPATRRGSSPHVRRCIGDQKERPGRIGWNVKEADARRPRLRARAIRNRAVTWATAGTRRICDLIITPGAVFLPPEPTPHSPRRSPWRGFSLRPGADVPPRPFAVLAVFRAMAQRADLCLAWILIQLPTLTLVEMFPRVQDQEQRAKRFL